MKLRTKKKLAERFGYKNYTEYKYFLSSLRIIFDGIMPRLQYKNHMIIDCKFKNNKLTMFTTRCYENNTGELPKLYITTNMGKTEIPNVFKWIFAAQIYNVNSCVMSSITEPLFVSPNYKGE